MTTCTPAGIVQTLKPAVIEENQLKTLGLAFGRSLQTALKLAVMYSVNDPATERALQQAFAHLSPIVRQQEEFTFGFLDDRIVLNKVRTRDASLDYLNEEFSKRRIGAVSLAPGLTFQEFKRGMEVLSAHAAAIAEAGGIDRFLERHPLRGIRILPTEKVRDLHGEGEPETRQAGVPADVHSRAPDDNVWSALPLRDRFDRLMKLERLAPQEFHRLVSLAQDLRRQGKMEEAVRLAHHYFSFLDSPSATARGEDLQRASELLRVCSGSETRGFMHTLTERLCQELLHEVEAPESYHRQVVNCLLGVAQNLVLDEDYEFVHRIGLELKQSLSRGEAQHRACCGDALARLLDPKDAARIVEIYLAKHDNSDWAKIATSLFKLPRSPGAEIIWQRLADERPATNRLRMIRLIGRLGPAAIEATRKRLDDKRWYVVRNACNILGDLGDPQLPYHLRPVLRQSELRVQQAALTAVIKSKAPSRASVLAEALMCLHERFIDIALDELTFLKDPESVVGIEQFLWPNINRNPALLQKAVAVLTAIPTDRAAEALGKVLSDKSHALPVRTAALMGLSKSPSSTASRLLAEFSRRKPDDTLVAESRKLLKTRWDA